MRIETPIEDLIDLQGWDIRKALRLFAKANPPLMEWLASSIYYDPHTCLHHYIHMARNNFREYLQGPTVWIKKYLYALRPILARRWIVQDRGPVPMEFNQLLATIEGRTDLIRETQALVDRKKAGDELDRGPAMPTIGTSVTGELQRLAVAIPRKPGAPLEIKPLQDLFLRSVAGM